MQPAIGASARPQPRFAAASPQPTAGQQDLRWQQSAVRPQLTVLRPPLVEAEAHQWPASLKLAQGSPGFGRHRVYQSPAEDERTVETPANL